MNILFLGPSCPRIEEHLIKQGHIVHCQEQPVSLGYLETNLFNFGISYRYRHILPPEIINYFQGNIINLHISLLPWNRGSDPNLWSFLDDTPKGVTIHKLSEKIDAGDILLQQEMTFDINKETLKTTYIALSNAVEDLFIKNADLLLFNKIIPKRQLDKGTFHRLHDKIHYLHLLEKHWWDTPINSLIKAARERERERERENSLAPSNTRG